MRPTFGGISNDDRLMIIDSETKGMIGAGSGGITKEWSVWAGKVTDNLIK